MLNQYYWSLEDPVMDIIAHHGILGMKWGIRRYQNPDGSLTPEGRARLGYDSKAFKNTWGKDVTLKKGTKTTRVLRAMGGTFVKYDEKTKGYVPVSKEQNQKMKEEALDEKERNRPEKYMSVKQDPKEGLKRGDAFYIDWFNKCLKDSSRIYVDEYVAKNPIKVASGEKLFDEIVKEYSDKKLNTVFDYVANADKSKTLFGKSNPEGDKSIDDRRTAISLSYTQNREMKERINNRLKEQGYDAVMDVNDPDTESPIIVFDTDKNFKRTNRSKVGDYINKNKKDLERLGYY